LKPYISVLGRKNYQDDFGDQFEVFDACTSVAETDKTSSAPDKSATIGQSPSEPVVASAEDHYASNEPPSESATPSGAKKPLARQSAADSAKSTFGQSSAADRHKSMTSMDSVIVPSDAEDSPSQSSTTVPFAAKDSSITLRSKKSRLTIADLNGTSVRTLLGKERIFNISLPIDSSWHLLHIVDAAILGGTQRQETYYLVAFANQPNTERWMLFDDIRSYHGGDNLLRLWDQELAAHLKRLRKIKLKKKLQSKTSAALPLTQPHTNEDV